MPSSPETPECVGSHRPPLELDGKQEPYLACKVSSEQRGREDSQRNLNQQLKNPNAPVQNIWKGPVTFLSSQLNNFTFVSAFLLK